MISLLTSGKLRATVVNTAPSVRRSL